MTYEIISVTDPDGNEQEFVKLITGENSYQSFPAENDNPNYIAFLAALEKENPKDPHFVAWVEAGNKPEDFWAQTQES